MPPQTLTVTHLLSYIVDNLERHNLKHEVHRFDSGAIMIDIWINGNFYVIQIDDNLIGQSLVTEDTTPFDIIPDISFSDEILFKSEFVKILPQEQSTTKKTLVIDGNNFTTLEEFYTEVDKVLTKNLNWNTGHNLDAFNDLLRGGFGVHEYNEPVKLIWENSNKSKVDLNQ
ncbi:barstar family protein [Niastella caeni]|uniref:barstar family protein n=1 Tax=Niastella caeni TaxID=2569763 RepID=UPI001AA08CD9|nr:barstar family protein [Niastella caeni]